MEHVIIDGFHFTDTNGRVLGWIARVETETGTGTGREMGIGVRSGKWAGRWWCV